jgi:thiol-disulfide isomerase/thioredoxin
MSSRFNSRLALSACIVLLVAPTSLLAQKRPAKEIAAELSNATRELQRYAFESQVNPKYQHQMVGELAAEYQKHLRLLEEYAAAAPAERNMLRPVKVRDLAVLALFKDADAIKQIETLKQSKTPADAAVGKLASLQLAWWSNPKAESQAKVLEDFKALAKTNPLEDAMTPVLLDIAKAGAANDTLANAARTLVETELKGPLALKYKARPDKLGRPLVISGVTVQGKSFTSESLKGKVLIVDFWATWCGPCREALPELAQFYEENKAKGLEVIGVSCDSRKPDLVEFLKENTNVTWPQLFGPSGSTGWHALAAKFQVSSVPTMYIIDREGILRAIENGRFPKAKIEALLETPAKPAAPKK